MLQCVDNISSSVIKCETKLLLTKRISQEFLRSHLFRFTWCFVSIRITAKKSSLLIVEKNGSARNEIDLSDIIEVQPHHYHAYHLEESNRPYCLSVKCLKDIEILFQFDERKDMDMFSIEMKNSLSENKKLKLIPLLTESLRGLLGSLQARVREQIRSESKKCSPFDPDFEDNETVCVDVSECSDGVHIQEYPMGAMLYGQKLAIARQVESARTLLWQSMQLRTRTKGTRLRSPPHSLSSPRPNVLVHNDEKSTQSSHSQDHGYVSTGASKSHCHESYKLHDGCNRYDGQEKCTEPDSESVGSDYPNYPAYTATLPCSVWHEVPVPRLNIVMLVVGTRGDVEPFIEIGCRLMSEGALVNYFIGVTIFSMPRCMSLSLSGTIPSHLTTNA